MIGYDITDENGQPLEQYKNLAKSSYQPNDEVKALFERCQKDYNVAFNLQRRPLDEFDGLSLLERTKRDQETFGAYVGAVYEPAHKKWRWKGRKNTARNKLIGILAHLLAGMLYPLVHAQNQEDEDDKLTARVMRILIEKHLKAANYEMKFLYMVLSALVNPAVIVEVDYYVAFQRIKEQVKSGAQVTEVIDDFLTGLSLNIIPVDQFLITDFYVPDVQTQPCVIRLQRMSWDKARAIYGSNPRFKFVEPGKTRVFMSGNDGATLYDVPWTEGDRNAVQVATFYYRSEDIEATFVGGVFVGNEKDVYNTNPYKHRRFTMAGDEWKLMPITPYAKSGFEPIDPAGRFFYYKSGAFKEYWDDDLQNKMHRLLVDGTHLDVMKPLFIAGLAKADANVIAPGAVVGMPKDANLTPFEMGSNLASAMQVMKMQEEHMSESTQDKIMQGQTTPGVTATQSIQAQNQARIFLGVFGMMMADLIRQIGELTMDCIISHTTEGEVDASIPEALAMKYKTVLAKTKDKGKDITNRIVFTDALMGKKMSEEELKKYEWDLWEKAGGYKTDQVIYHVNPYRFARTKYSFYVDPDSIINHAMGNDRQQKLLAFQLLTDPRVVPYTNQKNVIDDFVIEEFSDGDPDRYRVDVNQMMSSVLGQPGMPGMPGQNPGAPVPPTAGKPASVGAGQLPTEMNAVML
jgi:hypothetical protein